MIDRMKKCRRCMVSKPATTEFFYKKRSSVEAICRACRRTERAEVSASMTSDELSALNARRRAARAANPERYRSSDRRRYKADPSKKLASVRKYRLSRPEEVKSSCAKHYRKYREKKLAQATAWAKANPDRKRQIGRALHRRRRLDPTYRLRRSVSAYVNYCLNGNKNGRKWERLVGYTIDDLKQHIERQFGRGMSWANYGKWHIDHITPASSFRYETPEDDEFKQCWALTNLRPMWGLDNISKGGKRLYLL